MALQMLILQLSASKPLNWLQLWTWQGKISLCSAASWDSTNLSIWLFQGRQIWCHPSQLPCWRLVHLRRHHLRVRVPGDGVRVLGHGCLGGGAGGEEDWDTEGVEVGDQGQAGGWRCSSHCSFQGRNQWITKIILTCSTICRTPLCTRCPPSPPRGCTRGRPPAPPGSTTAEY